MEYVRKTISQMKDEGEARCDKTELQIIKTAQLIIDTIMEARKADGGDDYRESTIGAHGLSINEWAMDLERDRTVMRRLDDVSGAIHTAVLNQAFDVMESEPKSEHPEPSK